MPGIADILKTGPTFSYEFFPPRGPGQEASLRATVGELARTHPDFISITCGAAGSSHDATSGLAIELQRTHPFQVMAHLTCVGHDRQGVLELLDAYSAGGVRNILALRGDGEATGDFRNAIDLAWLIRSSHPEMSVGVAAHPEIHPRSGSRESDRLHLARKLQVADFAITQFVFDADYYRQLVDELSALGCDRPVIPGIMLFSSVGGLRRIAGLNHTTIPPDLNEQLDHVSPADLSRLAVDRAVELVADLRRDGVPGLHVYTMNKSGPALEFAKLVDE